MRQCGWIGGFRIFLWILIPLCLTGCANRELENRSFPSVLAVREAGIETSMEERQSRSRLYLDYGHVKAVIINKDLVPDIQSLKEILGYLEKRPVFARNILVLAAEDDVLVTAEMQADEMGGNLQNIFNNQVVEEKLKSVTLGDLLNFWHNHEPVIEVPVLELVEGDLVVNEYILVENGAVPTMGMPVPAKATE